MYAKGNVFLNSYIAQDCPDLRARNILKHFLNMSVALRQRHKISKYLANNVQNVSCFCFLV